MSSAQNMRHIHQEFESHIADTADDLVREGHEPQEAWRIARTQFGDMRQATAEVLEIENQRS